MPHRLTLVEMARQIRKRDLSPVELVQAHLAQIAASNPAINAFVVQLASQALDLARRQESCLPNGPLAGVPVTVKDSFDMEGLPTLCGSRYRLQHTAVSDATVVSRLRAAGAIILGKTNCPEFLANWETDNAITGRTNNPWNLDCAAGGSSGGEAAAIAAFCSAGGVGSDGGGSIRIPAHFCGIAGLKPTPGRVPATGHFPEICHPGGLLGVAGPMARTVADVRVLFEVLAGYDSADPFSAPVPLRKLSLGDRSIGVMEQFLDVPVNASMRRAVLKASAILASIGFNVDSFTPAGLERARETWWFFFGELSAPFTREIVERRPQDAHWTGTELLNRTDPTRSITGREVAERLAARDRMRATLLRQMEGTPVILMPVCATAAFPHRTRRWDIDGNSLDLLDIMAPVTPWNLLGFPALTVPMDFDDRGLPVGVQLVGRPYEEELLLEIGERLEEARGALPGRCS